MSLGGGDLTVVEVNVVSQSVKAMNGRRVWLNSRNVKRAVYLKIR